MKKLRDYSKPLMVTEKFSSDQYVAICALPAQYLYMDGIKATQHWYGTTYSSGSDKIFQDDSHASGLQGIINLILSIFTGNTFDTDGEFTGTRTTANPSQKGEVVTLNWLGNYPIYGSETLLNDGATYPGPDLRGSLKKVDATNEYYVQGNMS